MKTPRWRPHSSRIRLLLWSLVALGSVCPRGFSQAPDGLRRKAVAERFSPVIYQDIAFHPRYDLITRVDFDGDFDGNNNAEHGRDPAFPLPGAVYGEVSAVTEDAYYLFYFFYHAKDYEIRPLELLPAVDHENDFEGMLLVVDRRTEQVLLAEAASHNKFYQYTNVVESTGTDDVDGRILFEKGHPLVASTSKGHGVTLIQKLPHRFAGGNGVVYRYKGGLAEVPGNDRDPDVGYELVPYDDLLARARGPFGGAYMFSKPFDFYGYLLGGYFTGRFSGPQGMARPKPPWGWFDKDDGTRRGDWYFDPAYAVNTHLGLGLSERYIYNHPMAVVFHHTAEAEQKVFGLMDRAAALFEGKPAAARHNYLMRLRLHPELRRRLAGALALPPAR